MYASLETINICTPTKTDLHFQKITELSQLEDFMSVLTPCFHFTENTHNTMQEVYSQALQTNQSELEHYLIRYKDKVVGTGSIFFGKQVPGLYNLAVLDEYRNQGIGTNFASRG